MFDNKSNIKILQKLVVPKDPNNNVLKWEWTIESLLINRRTNIHPFIESDNDINFYAIDNNTGIRNKELRVKAQQNTEIEYYERIVNYEGPDHLSIEDKVISINLTNEI